MGSAGLALAPSVEEPGIPLLPPGGACVELVLNLATRAASLRAIHCLVYARPSKLFSERQNVICYERHITSATNISSVTFCKKYNGL